MRSAVRRRGLQDVDQDLDKALATDLDELRRLIADSILDRDPEFRAAIKLSCENEQFQQDVIEAVLWCALEHQSGRAQAHQYPSQTNATRQY